MKRHSRHLLALILTATLSDASGEPAKAPRIPDPAAFDLARHYQESAGGQALVVMHDGKILFESYDHGGGTVQRQMLASGSKSFVGVAALAALEDGFIRLDSLASESLPEWKNDPKKARITYRQLLTLTSGVLAGERGAATRSPSWKDIIAKPASGEPGERFEYGAYHLVAFCEALQHKLGGESFEAYLKRRVLDPIGVTVDWRMRCADGQPQVGGGAYMTARDWATFGEFVRLSGAWKGKQIIRADLFPTLTQGTPQNPTYGLTWWLAKPVSAELMRAIPILQRDMGDIVNARWLPADLSLAAGAGKQRLYLIPSLKLVIVRQGPLSAAGKFSDIEFLSRLLLGKADEKDPADASADNTADQPKRGGSVELRKTDGADAGGTPAPNLKPPAPASSADSEARSPDRRARLREFLQRRKKDGGEAAPPSANPKPAEAAPTKTDSAPASKTDPAVSASASFISAEGPLAVREVEVKIPGERWQKEIALRLYYPGGGGPHPLIVFCAGSGGGNDSFAPTSRYLASHGYVVLHTSYPVSARHGGTFGTEGANAALTRNRIADIGLALDSLDQIAELQPELKGRIDATAIGAAGHSSGAYIAQLLAGATVVWDGREQSLRDERIKAVIQYSGQGSDQQGLTKASWKILTVPMLTTTGTRDRGATGGGPAWKKEPFDLSPAGGKYHVCYEGGHHGSFSGRFTGGGGEGEGAAIFDHAKMLTLAFWNATLKGDAAARQFLDSDAAKSLNTARCEYARR